MASYVVDASVVIEYLLTGPFTPNAEALFEQTGSPDRLLIPEFCLLECTNVIWKQVRFQGMPSAQATIMLNDLRALPLRRVPMKRLLGSALQIGLRHSLAVYDSAYLALALRSQIPFISVDTAQSRVALAEGLTLKPITDFVP